MQTLRNSNTMLKTALEESAQHVTEWKKQLQKYKDECDQLKKKVTVTTHYLFILSLSLFHFLFLSLSLSSKVTKQEDNSQEIESVTKENEELKDVLSAVQIDLQDKRTVR